MRLLGGIGKALKGLKKATIGLGKLGAKILVGSTNQNDPYGSENDVGSNLGTTKLAANGGEKKKASPVAPAKPEPGIEERPRAYLQARKKLVSSAAEKKDTLIAKVKLARMSVTGKSETQKKGVTPKGLQGLAQAGTALRAKVKPVEKFLGIGKKQLGFAPSKFRHPAALRQPRMR
jgi:hypothetical protein